MVQKSIPESDHHGSNDAPVVSGHTPGPWVVNGEVREVGADGGEKHRLYCADIVLGAEWRGYVASVQSCDHIDGITREEAEANARLIAAAPDLVKALESALCELSACANQLADLGRNVPPNGSVNRAIVSARNTIAAAKVPAPFYGAQCPSYPNCTGGCGLGCTHDIEGSPAALAAAKRGA